MRNIVENYTPGCNFWEDNPQFTSIGEFKNLYKSDKSKSKKDSSLTMWAIALCYHPKSDLFYVGNKLELIAKDMLSIKDKDIDKFWDEHKSIVELFIETTTTQAEKSLVSWDNRLKKRDEFIDGQDYTFGYTDEDGVEYKDNTKALDDMCSKTAKFYEEYFKIQKDLKEEEVVKGNKREKSSTATGDI